MKKSVLTALITLLFISCSSPIERKYNEHNIKSDIAAIKKKLNTKDFEILENSIIRLNYNTEKLEQMTYFEILENGKIWKNSQKKEESKIIQLINFEKEKKVRFKKVIEKLKIIRDAEISYKETKGKYTADKNELLKLMNNKDIFKVPFTNKEFELNIGKVEKFSGLFVPIFEIKTDKESILKGLNKSLIKKEKEKVLSYEIRGEYISIGSLEEVTTKGNWPPFYDRN
jgi:hypothetical protein